MEIRQLRVARPELGYFKYGLRALCQKGKFFAIYVRRKIAVPKCDAQDGAVGAGDT